MAARMRSASSLEGSGSDWGSITRRCGVVPPASFESGACIEDPAPKYENACTTGDRSDVTKRHLVIFGAQFWRPYLHVRDAAEVMRLVLAAPLERVAGQVFNAGDSGQNYQKGHLVEMIRAQLDYETEVEQVEKQEDPRNYRVSFDKIRSHLGFSANRTVEDGIREVRTAIEDGLITDVDNPRYHN